MSTVYVNADAILKAAKEIQIGGWTAYGFTPETFAGDWMSWRDNNKRDEAADQAWELNRKRAEY